LRGRGKRRHRRNTLVLALLALCFLGMSCAKARERAECKTFIGRLNGAIAETDKGIARLPEGSRNAPQMLELAKHYDSLATQVEEIQLENPELAQHSREYANMVQRAAAAARLMASALEQSDPKKLELAKQSWTTAVADAQKLQTQINLTCAARGDAASQLGSLEHLFQ